MASGKKGPTIKVWQLKSSVAPPKTSAQTVGMRARDEAEARVRAQLVVFDGARCEEASMLSRGKYIPCAAPAVAVVWHEKDHRAYLMCAACADHNVRNRGGVLLASKPERASLPKAKIGPVAGEIVKMMIPTAAVLAVKALQQERKALEGKLELVKKDLKAQEPPIIAALEAGLPTEPGCPPCAVDVEERITPGWKAEALVLAAAAGKNVEVYEAEIRAKTAPTVIKRLIINGREGK